MSWTSKGRGSALALAIASAACTASEPAAEIPVLSADVDARAQPFGSVAYEELEPLPDGGSLEALEDALPWLARRGVALSMQWKAERIDDPVRWRVVDAARALGIAVHPVLTLPEGTDDDESPSAPRYAQTGYFPNASNFAAWIAASEALMDAWLARGLDPTTMVVDMEMRKRRLHRLHALTSGREDALGTLLLLAEGVDRARQARAIEAFSRYADRAHARGFRLQVTTLLPMLDDYLDGDDSLRQAFGVPLANDPRQVPFDGVSFQLHRTLYQERYAGLTSYFVFDYARAAVALLGARAGIDVGLTHGGIVPSAAVYADPDDLRSDVAAAVAAGISLPNVSVYSLIGILDRPRIAAWLEPAASMPPPRDDRVTARSHTDWGLLDLVLP